MLQYRAAGSALVSLWKCVVRENDESPDRLKCAKRGKRRIFKRDRNGTRPGGSVHAGRRLEGQMTCGPLAVLISRISGFILSSRPSNCGSVLSIEGRDGRYPHAEETAAGYAQLTRPCSLQLDPASPICSDVGRHISHIPWPLPSRARLRDESSCRTRNTIHRDEAVQTLAK